MSDSSITIAGIVVPSTDPRFLSVLAVHVLAAMLAVASGATAMLSAKQRGRHTRAGTLYYRSLIGVVGSMAILSAMRWSQDYRLFMLGCLSLLMAIAARRSIRRAGSHRIRLHVTGMAGSYIVLLIAFYVDNGKNLPLWRDLPAITYWLVPLVVGSCLTAWVLIRHPLLKAERVSAAPPHLGA